MGGGDDFSIDDQGGGAVMIECRDAQDCFRHDPVPFLENDGVAKSPPHGVTVIYQDLDIQHVLLRP
jgi:hypothetical protein